jgi:hypothetical protein
MAVSQIGAIELVQLAELWHVTQTPGETQVPVPPAPQALPAVVQ